MTGSESFRKTVTPLIYLFVFQDPEIISFCTVSFCDFLFLFLFSETKTEG